MSKFLERLSRGPILCDGAMGTLLYAKGVFINRCYDELNISQPEIVAAVHEEYAKAGAEILETNTFGANRYRLFRHGFEARVKEINRAGVRLARTAAGTDLMVAGSVGPLGMRIEPLGKIGRDEARAAFREQIEVLAGEGVDLILLETFGYIDELHQAVLAAQEAAPGMAIVAEVTTDEEGIALDGAEPEAFGVRLTEFGVDVLGCNCSIGPAPMLDTIERLHRVTSLPLAAQPNAGMPRSVEGRNIYLCSPEYMATYAPRFGGRGATGGRMLRHDSGTHPCNEIGGEGGSGANIVVPRGRGEAGDAAGGEAAGGTLPVGTEAGGGRVCDHGGDCAAQGSGSGQGTGGGEVSARGGH